MLKWLARGILKVGGWSTAGALPESPKAVFVAAPHTSNWDGVWALVYKVAVGLDIRFFAKHTLFWFPLNLLLRGLGGIPLDRSAAASAVDEAVRMFAENESFYFGLAPEGTRSLTDGWKTGFYRIALEAGVPVVAGFLDYGNRRIGIHPAVELSGNADADLARLADLYKDIEGRWPEKASPIRFQTKRPPQ